MIKEKIQYVNNKEFTNAIVEYKKQCEKCEKENKSIPEVTDYIAESIMKISEKLSRSSNFIGYTYREEMVMDAVENCLKVIRNYDIEKATRSGEPNAFGYFTQIAYYAFLRRIQREKRQLDIKNKILERTGFDEVFHDDSGIDGMNYSDYNSIKDSVHSKLRS